MILEGHSTFATQFTANGERRLQVSSAYLHVERVAMAESFALRLLRPRIKW